MNSAASGEGLRKTIRLASNTAFAAYLGLFLVEVSVAASSLPYVYVSDPRANCGARFLVYFSVGKMLFSGGMLFALAINRFLSDLPQLPRRYEPFRQLAHLAIISFLTLVFFLLALNQLLVFRRPPPVPPDLRNCEAMGAAPR